MIGPGPLKVVGRYRYATRIAAMAASNNSCGYSWEYHFRPREVKAQKGGLASGRDVTPSNSYRWPPQTFPLQGNGLFESVPCQVSWLMPSISSDENRRLYGTCRRGSRISTPSGSNRTNKSDSEPRLPGRILRNSGSD